MMKLGMVNGTPVSPSPLARDLFSSTVWFHNSISTRSLFVSEKNCANSWEPVGDQTHMGFALIELMMWRRPLNKW